MGTCLQLSRPLAAARHLRNCTPIHAPIWQQHSRSMAAEGAHSTDFKALAHQYLLPSSLNCTSTDGTRRPASTLFTRPT